MLAALSCLLLIGFAGASYGSVNFAVQTTPSEVINTGMSEVLGSITLRVEGPGNVTGGTGGVPATVAVTYNVNGTHVEIDNNLSTGILLYASTNFVTANAHIVTPAGNNWNKSLGGITYGEIDVTMNGGTALVGYDTVGYDYLRLEGVRGRIATSTAVTQLNDLFAKLQSIGDQTAFLFTQDVNTVRVATSYPGMQVAVNNDTSLLLCFPTFGFPPRQSIEYGSYIKITEGFARAFVDANADYNNRIDSNSNLLGNPTNSTEVIVYLTDIPSSVSAIDWDSTVSEDGGVASYLNLEDTGFNGAGDAWAIYSYQASNQLGESDLVQETFTLVPFVYIGANQTDTGTLLARASLYPNNDPHLVRPRFVNVPQSDADQSNTYPGSADPYLPYLTIIRCNCYMLFSYVAARSGFDTGFAVANTSMDSQVFGSSLSAPEQEGPITFYFYDAADGYVGSVDTDTVAAGQTYTGLLSQMLGTLGISEFSGYVIAKAEFQYCHAVSYIADSNFAVSAQGYSALIIPDPAVKGRRFQHYRTATAASDVDHLIPAGESLNN